MPKGAPLPTTADVGGTADMVVDRRTSGGAKVTVTVVVVVRPDSSVTTTTTTCVGVVATSDAPGTAVMLQAFSGSRRSAAVCIRAHDGESSNNVELLGPRVKLYALVDTIDAHAATLGGHTSSGSSAPIVATTLPVVAFWPSSTTTVPGADEEEGPDDTTETPVGASGVSAMRTSTEPDPTLPVLLSTPVKTTGTAAESGETWFVS
jgi:hypothetical protein